MSPRWYWHCKCRRQTWEDTRNVLQLQAWFSSHTVSETSVSTARVNANARSMLTFMQYVLARSIAAVCIKAIKRQAFHWTIANNVSVDRPARFLGRRGASVPYRLQAHSSLLSNTDGIGHCIENAADPPQQEAGRSSSSSGARDRAGVYRWSRHHGLREPSLPIRAIDDCRWRF
jgi:hypothetical protein